MLKKGKQQQKSNRVLPIEEKKADIIDAAKVQCVFIVGKTGSGKSTKVPQYLIEGDGNQSRVLMAQPRRLAASSLAERIGKERGFNSLEDPDCDVAYHIGGITKGNANSARILIVTYGILLNMLTAEGNASSKFKIIILDEIHERSMEFDLCLPILKSRLLDSDPANTFTLIMMSATINVQPFKDYFKVPNSQIINVEKSNHKVLRFFLEDILQKCSVQQKTRSGATMKPQEGFGQIVTEARREILLKLLVHLHTKTPMTKGIIVFLSGIALLNEIRTLLEVHLDDSNIKYEIIMLHRIFPLEEQKRAVTPFQGRRKIILSTNIAESSLTIPDACIVVDTATIKRLIYDEDAGTYVLQERFASKATLIQREGRVGRVQGGAYYCLITRSEYQERRDWNEPEIRHRPFTEVLLKLIHHRIMKMVHLLMDSPSPKQIEEALNQLVYIHAIEKRDETYEVTSLGKLLVDLSLSPSLALLVYVGYVLGVHEEAIVAACILALKNPIIFTTKRPIETYLQKLRYSADDDDSDVIAGVRAYYYWIQKRKEFNSLEEEIDFCKRNFLSYYNLNEIHGLKIQIADKCYSKGFGNKPDRDDYDFLKNYLKQQEDAAGLNEEDEGEEEFIDNNDQDAENPEAFGFTQMENVEISDKFSSISKDLDWDPIHESHNFNHQSLKIAIVGALRKQAEVVSWNDFRAEIMVKVVLKSPIVNSGAIAQELTNQFKPFLQSKFVLAPSKREIQLSSCTNEKENISLRNYLSKGALKRAADFPMTFILASKLKHLGTDLLVSKCVIEGEGSIGGAKDDDELMNDESYLRALLKSITTNPIILDSLSVNHPLLSGSVHQDPPRKMMIVPGQVKVVSGSGGNKRVFKILLETTLVTAEFFELVESLFERSKICPSDELSDLKVKLWFTKPQEILTGIEKGFVIDVK